MRINKNIWMFVFGNTLPAKVIASSPLASRLRASNGNVPVRECGLIALFCAEKRLVVQCSSILVQNSLASVA